MYRAYQGRNEIVLWIKNEQPQRKRGCTSADDVPVSAKVSKSRYDDHVRKTCELDEIVEKLQAKQGSRYSPEQLRAWAQLKKYDSYSSPPDKPFFRSKSKAGKEFEASEITLRSECITQLDKWHSLFEKNTITKEQYKELQTTILEDIKKC